MDLEAYLGQVVTVTVDRAAGSRHPEHNFVYPVNYGFIAGTRSADGEELDAYVLGVFDPVDSFTGEVIAALNRSDGDHKLVVVPTGRKFSSEQIRALTEFQERWFDSEIIEATERKDEDAPLQLGWPVWLGVVCEDLEKQRTFYREVLGLHETRSASDWVWFELDGNLLELLAKSPRPQYDERRVSFAFEVEDIQAARTELIRRGVEAVTDVEGGPSATQYWAYFRDPEGNLFELLQRLK